MSSGKNSKLSKRRKRSQQKLTMIKKVVIKDSNSDSDSDSNSINQYITPKNKNIVKPKVWELNNRKTFIIGFISNIINMIALIIKK